MKSFFQITARSTRLLIPLVFGSFVWHKQITCKLAEPSESSPFPEHLLRETSGVKVVSFENSEAVDSFVATIEKITNADVNFFVTAANEESVNRVKKALTEMNKDYTTIFGSDSWEAVKEKPVLLINKYGDAIAFKPSDAANFVENNNFLKNIPFLESSAVKLSPSNTFFLVLANCDNSASLDYFLKMFYFSTKENLKLMLGTPETLQELGIAPKNTALYLIRRRDLVNEGEDVHKTAIENFEYKEINLEKMERKATVAIKVREVQKQLSAAGYHFYIHNNQEPEVMIKMLEHFYRDEELIIFNGDLHNKTHLAALRLLKTELSKNDRNASLVVSDNSKTKDVYLVKSFGNRTADLRKSYLKETKINIAKHYTPETSLRNMIKNQEINEKTVAALVNSTVPTLETTKLFSLKIAPKAKLVSEENLKFELKDLRDGYLLIKEHNERFNEAVLTSLDKIARSEGKKLLVMRRREANLNELESLTGIKIGGTFPTLVVFEDGVARVIDGRRLVLPKLNAERLEEVIRI